ncbi:MAG: hypothetical protein QOI53_3470, partial [Verrucomicrobiota bacterium]|nr:hypothetical protein [Verrucomicrobiota bacterium]
SALRDERPVHELRDRAPGRVVERVEIAAAGQPLMIGQR